MSNYPQNPEEHERQMAQRRKQNRIVVLGIGAVLLILLAVFSPFPYAWAYILGIFVVIGVMLYARSLIEKHYKAELRQRLEEEAKAMEEAKDE